MKRTVIIVSTVAIVHFLLPVVTAASSEISAERAWHLAATYYHRYVSGCGGVGEVVARGNYWDAPVHFGYAGTFRGYIRVDRRTGTVSYSGHPTVSAQSLDSRLHLSLRDPMQP